VGYLFYNQYVMSKYIIGICAIAIATIFLWAEQFKYTTLPTKSVLPLQREFVDTLYLSEGIIEIPKGIVIHTKTVILP